MATNKERRGGSVRTGSQVGPDYADGKRVNPWNQDIVEGTFGDGDDKAILSENTVTFEGGGMPIKHGYDELWEGK